MRTFVDQDQTPHNSLSDHRSTMKCMLTLPAGKIADYFNVLPLLGGFCFIHMHRLIKFQIYIQKKSDHVHLDARGRIADECVIRDGVGRDQTSQTCRPILELHRPKMRFPLD